MREPFKALRDDYDVDIDDIDFGEIPDEKCTPTTKRLLAAALSLLAVIVAIVISTRN